MKIKKLWQPALKSLLPLFLIIANVDEIIGLLKDEDAYSFSSGFADYSIYIFYLILFTIVLLLMIYYAFKHNKKFYLITLFLAIIFFFYPIITSNY